MLLGDMTYRASVWCRADMAMLLAYGARLTQRMLLQAFSISTMVGIVMSFAL